MKGRRYGGRERPHGGLEVRKDDHEGRRERPQSEEDREGW